MFLHLALRAGPSRSDKKFFAVFNANYVMDNIVHVSSCTYSECQILACREMKESFEHVQQCDVLDISRYDVCSSFTLDALRHSKNFQTNGCRAPFCAKLYSAEGGSASAEEGNCQYRKWSCQCRRGDRREQKWERPVQKWERPVQKWERPVPRRW
ncbi:hypothetical protein NPIL_460631 [Nephila pilipes]|uniref:Uncharacterized protein n=1 Tax=Nephila pilipes TaxID=299642 RepID=A0A8X6PXQ0_NEPPI|nr:hypothetical protein NPIL_460631 [Nephila pilipes]